MADTRKPTDRENNNNQQSSSWRTSHLPPLNGRERQFILDLMHGWYHGTKLRAPEGADLPLLGEYIDRQGLGGVLGAMCLDGLLNLPEDIEERAGHRYFSTQVHFEQAKRCCRAVVKAASDLDIPVTVLKGPALVGQGYEDPGVRQFSDIDLFTDSPHSVKLLAEALGAKTIKDSDKHRFWMKMAESDVMSLFYDNWELEFRYPLEPPCEPMFAFLSYHRQKLLLIPSTVEGLLNPMPELHLVYLLQHMAIHHLLSRFFWFLDIAVFLRHNPQLDLEMVTRELGRFGHYNVATVVTEFCRTHIDSNLPVFTRSRNFWNIKIMESFAAPENIASGKYGIYHRTPGAKAYGYLVSTVSFYLVADPKERSWTWDRGTEWTLYRFRNALGLKKPLLPLDLLFSLGIAGALIPLSRLVALLAGRRSGTA